MLTVIFTLKITTIINLRINHTKKMTYVKINKETFSNFTAQVKTKLCHNTTIEQYEDIIKPWFDEKLKDKLVS